MRKAFVTAAVLASISGVPALATPSGSIQSNSDSSALSQSAINSQGDNVRASSVVAPAGNNTAPCVLAPSFGVGGNGVGIGFSTPYIDKKCEIRKEASVLSAIAAMRGDQRRVAIYHLCANDKQMRQTLVAMGWCVVK